MLGCDCMSVCMKVLLRSVPIYVSVASLDQGRSLKDA